MTWDSFAVVFLSLALAGVPSSHALHLAVIEPVSEGAGRDEPFLEAADTWPTRTQGGATTAQDAEAPLALGVVPAAPGAVEARGSRRRREMEIFTLLIAGVASMAYVAQRRRRVD